MKYSNNDRATPGGGLQPLSLSPDPGRRPRTDAPICHRTVSHQHGGGSDAVPPRTPPVPTEPRSPHCEAAPRSPPPPHSPEQHHGNFGSTNTAISPPFCCA